MKDILDVIDNLLEIVRRHSGLTSLYGCSDYSLIQSSISLLESIELPEREE